MHRCALFDSVVVERMHWTMKNTFVEKFTNLRGRKLFNFGKTLKSILILRRFFLDTSPFVVPTFVTKLSEYLCSGWVFFLQTNSTYQLTIFDWVFVMSFKRYCCPELKFEKTIHLRSKLKSFFLIWDFLWI